jgi:hypothetical protein
MLVPRELKLEHSGGVKGMSDAQLEQAIEAIQAMLAAQAGEATKVIEGTAEPAALPAPNGPSPEAALEANLEPTRGKPNRLMIAHVIARLHGSFRRDSGHVTGQEITALAETLVKGCVLAAAANSGSARCCYGSQKWKEKP